MVKLVDPFKRCITMFSGKNTNFMQLCVCIGVNSETLALVPFVASCDEGKCEHETCQARTHQRCTASEAKSQSQSQSESQSQAQHPCPYHLSAIGGVLKARIERGLKRSWEDSCSHLASVCNHPQPSCHHQHLTACIECLKTALCEVGEDQQDGDDAKVSSDTPTSLMTLMGLMGSPAR